MKRKLMGDAHPSLATSLQNLAGVLLVKGDYKTAEPLLKEAMQISQKALAPDHWMLAESRSNYGACLTKLGRYRKAEEHLLVAHARLKTSLGDGHKRTQKAVQSIIKLYDTWGKADEATSYRALLQNNQSQ
jgi:tetratricopeptide (TPR) repeat protein